MSGKLSGQLAKTGFLKGARASVLLALASVSDNHGQSWYSLKGLAHLSRRTKKTTITEIKWLERHYLVSVQRGIDLTTARGHLTRGSNLYTLNLPFLESLILISDTVQKLAPGGAGQKWETTQRVADWAFEMVENFAWEEVVALARKRPQEIRRIAAGLQGQAGHGQIRSDAQEC